MNVDLTESLLNGDECIYFKIEIIMKSNCNE